MFPNRLESLRKARKLSQQYMGDYLGVTRQAYAKYENGDSEPDIATITKLASFFDVSTDFLLGKTDKRDGQADQNNLNDQSDLKEKDIEEIIDDPQLGLWFKAGKETSPENRKKALEFLKFIEEQEKDRKPGDKQK